MPLKRTEGTQFCYGWLQRRFDFDSTMRKPFDDLRMTVRLPMCVGCCIAA